MMHSHFLADAGRLFRRNSPLTTANTQTTDGRSVLRILFLLPSLVWCGWVSGSFASTDHIFVDGETGN